MARASHRTTLLILIVVGAMLSPAFGSALAPAVSGPTTIAAPTGPTTFLLGTRAAPPGPIAYPAAITIAGDADLLAMAQQGNWTGHGTTDDPFIAMDLNITMVLGIGLEITDTSLVVEFQDLVIAGSGAGTGISVRSASGITFTDPLIRNVEVGIEVNAGYRIAILAGAITDAATVAVRFQESRFCDLIGMSIDGQGETAINIVGGESISVIGVTVGPAAGPLVNQDSSWTWVEGSVLAGLEDLGSSNTTVWSNGIDGQVSLERSFRADLQDNTISVPLRVAQVLGLVLYNNSLSAAGIVIDTTTDHFLDSWDVGPNTVGGFPLFYTRGISAAGLGPQLGQLIAIDCQRLTWTDRNQPSSNATHYFVDCSQVEISGGDFSGQGLTFLTSHNNQVRNATFTTLGPGVELLQGSTGNRVLGNTFNGPGPAPQNASASIGVRIIAGIGNEVSGNTFIGLGQAIDLLTTIRTLVTKNSFEADPGTATAINISSGADLTITGNTLVMDGGWGIWVGDGSHDLNISANRIQGADTGIRLDALDSTVSGNEISGNGGIGLDVSGSGNQIFHNLFADNGQDARNSGANRWDAGYPIGGNHWSGHLNDDVSFGVDQDLPGADGIADSPFEIPGGGLDAYPVASVENLSKAVVGIPPVAPDSPQAWWSWWLLLGIWIVLIPVFPIVGYLLFGTKRWKDRHKNRPKEGLIIDPATGKPIEKEPGDRDA